MIGVVDYGLSNITCVCSAISYLGKEFVKIDKPDELKKVDKIILPGVGAFGDAIKNLKKRKLFYELEEQILVKRSFFRDLSWAHICKASEEFGNHEGFGWIDGHVKNFIKFSIYKSSPLWVE